MSITEENSSEMEEFDFSEWKMFYEEMYDALVSNVKQILNDYFGKYMFNLQSETYIEIEECIKYQFEDADFIADILNTKRVSENDDELEKIFIDFIKQKKKITWIQKEQWFEEVLKDDFPENENLLESINPELMHEDDKKILDLLEVAGGLLGHHYKIAHFNAFGYPILLKEIQSYLERESTYSLSVLTPEGIEELSETIDDLINDLLENLGEIVYKDIENNE
ncbi:MAG: hypothetical protein R2771_11620 [Saprospiraceae bacterium]